MTAVQTHERNHAETCYHGFLYLLFFLVLVLAYHNSFNAGWHLDDIGNILLNPPLHLTDLSPASLKQSLFAYPEQPGKLFRPIPNLLSGINWFFGQDNVFGYHIVNFIIHFLTTIALYHACLLLLRTPRLHASYQGYQVFIAGTAAILWGLNPIQTQAVTYIVQRMASLSALFYVAGIYFFLRARLENSIDRKSLLACSAAVLCFFLAIGSKENSIVFPASLMLIEIIFFQQAKILNRNRLLVFASGFLLIAACSMILVGPGFILNVFGSYETRDFTVWQRIITESRVVVFYLSLLFFPIPWRLSISHDFSYSLSLFSPLSTLSAIAVLAVLTVAPMIFYRRIPLISFALLFFLLNHLVESTIIPLELVFEHRNYLPSLFLFLPAAAGIGSLLDSYRHSDTIVYAVILSLTIGLFVLLSLWTIERNDVWKTEKSLWTDALAKSPESSRPYINLAHAYLYKDHQYQAAFNLLNLSLTKQSPTPWKDRYRAYLNMGYIMNQIGRYNQALAFFEQAETVIAPGSESTFTLGIAINKGRAQFLSNRRQEGVKNLSVIAARYPDHPEMLLLYGEMLAADHQLEQSIMVLKQVLGTAPFGSSGYAQALLDLSLIYGKHHEVQKADYFLNFAKRLGSSPLLLTNLVRLERSIRQKEAESADKAMKSLLSELSWPELMTILDNTGPTRPTIPISHALLLDFSVEWLAAQKT